MSEYTTQDQANSVLVVGGGIAGIKAALDLAEAGRKVYLVDKSPALGGFLPLLDRQFPTNDCQICYLSPELAQSGFDLDIEVLPLATLSSLEGQAGDFTATIEQNPRYIDTALCTACGECLEAAPQGAVSFTPGLDHRAPTCMRYPQQVPTSFAIDIEKVGEDTSWTKVCQPGAIKLDMAPSTQKLSVGSVIVATGAEVFDPGQGAQLYGYNTYPDVVTSLEFERILSASGPTGGAFTRPSDGRVPKRIGWIQCVGSRSTQEPAKPYCSSICCMFAMKEALWAKEHFADDLDATIFYMDMRPMGRDYEQYYQRAKNEGGINFLRCRPHTVTRDEASGDLLLEYAGADGKMTQAALDMIVLSTGFCAPTDAKELHQALGIESDEFGFVKSSETNPVATSLDGVYAAGMALGPRDIPDSVTLGSASACLAASHLGPAEGPQAKQDLPPERELYDEEPKVGIFLSDFGGSVKARVDFDEIKKYFEGRDDVAHIEELEFLWTSSGLDHMVRQIKRKNLNRVVVAGCSPRSHTTLFQETIRRAGLNRNLLEMANIREQDAWVHAKDMAAATTKAVDLIRMAVAGVRAAQPFYTHQRDLEKSALVLGGGVAGMSSALALAGQGVKVHLIERGPSLGGLAMHLERGLKGAPVRPMVEALIEQVKADENITVLTNALVVDHDGQMGDFTTGVQSGPGMYYEKIRHGVAVIATGAKGYQPTEYLYGQDPRIMTQQDLEQKLAGADASDEALKRVVMIQCVGARNEQNPGCGRICCRAAVKNALWIKELNPEAEIIVLYRDMRMPYTAEIAYRQAREAGVLFVRYEPEDMPQLEKDGDALKLTFTDPVLERPLVVSPSALVLSVPQIADDEENEELAEIFRLPQGPGGFLLESHVKYKPVDGPAPGIFLAGSVLSPKSLEESRIQGLAAAGRALTVLARSSLEVAGGVAKVNPDRCASCLVCVRACPFEVPFINADGVSEIDPAKCQGCGLCAAECPAKAILLQGFTDDQIMGKTDALLEGILA